MPPRNDDLETDITDIKSLLQFLCKSVDELKHSNSTIEKKINELLRMINDERIEILENRVNELEQHSRKRDIIVSGLNLHSYAHTTTRSRSQITPTQTHTTTRSRSARTPTQTNDGNDINESSTMR